MSFALQQIDHVALTVRDVQRSIDWYHDVLGLERRFEDDWGDYPAVVCAGTTCLALFPADTPDPKPHPGRDTLGAWHVGFLVDRENFEAARARFAETGIDARFADHGVAHSVYISDPDGYTIEITTYDV
jgi:catechol 2,3-dioxygenase-like lactoylglutathione lyase family enzyme